jgi:hypothetical protein
MRLIITTLAAIILAFAVAETTPAQAKVKFSSVYSNLRSNCKSFDGENGSDGYSICGGPGGYRIRVYYSAASVHYNAEIAKGENSNFPITMLAISFDDKRTRLEWRLANGKPFAVIMRTPTYAAPVEEYEYYGPVNGERLVVRGLRDIELDGAVDGRVPNANTVARELADAAYLKRKGN